MKKVLIVFLCVLMCVPFVSQAEEASGVAGIYESMTADITALMATLPQLTVGALSENSNEFSLPTAYLLLSTSASQEAQAAQLLLMSMGLTTLKQDHYGKPLTDHSHTSAYTLASGKMQVRGEERNVALITIRGTGDAEWYSNFDFAGESKGECVYAENFMAAAQDIYDGVKELLDGMENPVILATGYSRGAACANLLGKLLDDAYGTEDVYVYTFATPTTVREPMEGYDNIFNIVNQNDIVTSLPIPMWGFTRLGKDIAMKDEKVSSLQMQALFMSTLAICPTIDSYYNDRHSLTQKGLADDGITMSELCLSFAEALTGGSGISEETKNYFMGIMQAENDFAQFLPMFAAMLQPGESGIPALLSQHSPLVYVELMKNLASDQ